RRAGPGFAGIGVGSGARHHRPRQLTGRVAASAPTPKLASLGDILWCELRNQGRTSKSMILVRFLDLKFL
ncbi:MAG: hypothetical protein ABSG76_05140, partial [Xanthobacteraceae bacterium]